MVRCCRAYEEVCEGDVGKVIKLDRDGLHDLNVQCDWQQKGGTYWVRYIHVELRGERFLPCVLCLFLNQREFLEVGADYRSFMPGIFRLSSTEFSFSHQDW